MADPSTAPVAAQIIDSLMPAITGVLVLLGGLAGTFLAHFLRSRTEANRAFRAAVVELVNAAGAIANADTDKLQDDAAVELLRAEVAVVLTLNRRIAVRFFEWWDDARIDALEEVAKDRSDGAIAIGDLIRKLQNFALTKQVPGK